MRINYNQIIRQAGSIDDQAGELENEIKRMENIVSAIGNGWDGPAATLYKRKLLNRINNLRGVEREMRKVSSLIKTVANRIKREDEIQAKKAGELAALDVAKNK